MSKFPSYTIDEKELTHINKICVICWGLIGDVFVRIPTIEALKIRFPDAKILVVVDPAGKRAIANHPDIDEIFVFDRSKQSKSKYIYRTIKNILHLRNYKFDLSVNLYSGGASPRIVRMINARIRLGFDHTKALRKSNNLLVKHPDLSKQWNRAFGSILQPLGIPPSSIRAGTSFYCSAEAEQFAKEFLADTSKKYFAINLGASKASRRWPIDKFVQFASVVSKDHELCPLVLSNPGMTELTEQFAEQYQTIGDFIKAPLVYMDKDAALIKRCQFVVTGDTSIMHLAFALKIPTLVLFTNTRPEPVLPEDCLYRYCFIPGTTEKDEFGQPLGVFDIPVALAIEKFDELVMASRNTHT
jgi:ADP-heptose:LPS heptosyltransferase